MSPTSREAMLKDLRRELKAAEDISVEDLACRIKEIGFRCLRCGDCCSGEDNSVVVFPFEIRRIMATSQRKWLDAVEPPATGEWDKEGNFHTLEWRLKKEGGDCIFFKEGECLIYGARPFICQTYPFYLDSGHLRNSECRGLGQDLDLSDAERLAALLVKRYKTELEEAIALLENYEDFERGKPAQCGSCIVHDSEGEHKINFKL